VNVTMEHTGKIIIRRRTFAVEEKLLTKSGIFATKEKIWYRNLEITQNTMKCVF